MRFSALFRAVRYAYSVSRTLQIILLLGATINGLILGIYTVNGQSMLPTLKPSSHILVNKTAYLLHPPALGDIVVVQYQDTSLTLVKRITGLPNSHEQTINGPIQLDANQYFVTGDNAVASTDSRVFGPIDKTAIVGKVVQLPSLSSLKRKEAVYSNSVSP